MSRRVLKAGEYLTPVIARGVFKRKSTLTERNDLESASHTARNRNAPMPATGLFKDVQYRDGRSG